MRLRERALNILAVVSTAVALFATLLAFNSARARGVPERPEHYRSWREIAGTGAQFGSENAPVTVTVFSDFQCPFCKRFAEVLRQAMRERPGLIKVVFRHYPIEHIHTAALPAAYASICADRQHRFEAMHDELFAQQDSLGKKPWTLIGRDAGILDTMQFSDCMKDTRNSEIVERDRTAGNQLKMRGTPTVLVNDVLVRWMPSPALLDSLIAQSVQNPSTSR